MTYSAILTRRQVSSPVHNDRTQPGEFASLKGQSIHSIESLNICNLCKLLQSIKQDISLLERLSVMRILGVRPA